MELLDFLSELVSETKGNKDSYIIKVRCLNCKSDLEESRVRYGVPLNKCICPNCGCAGYLV